MINLKINVDENIFYLHEYLKSLEKITEFKIQYEFFKSNILENLNFLFHTTEKIEKSLPKEIKNSNSIKNLRKIMKLKISIKNCCENILEEKNKFNFDEKQIIQFNQIIDKINKSIENIIEIMEKNKEAINTTSCLSNTEINLLLADFY